MTQERLPGFVEWLGIEERDLGPGRVGCRLRTTEEHQNIQGVIHGLVATALMDTAMGHAISGLLAEDEFTTTTQLSVQFLKAARPGDVLDAEGTVMRRGRRIAYLDGVCRNADGDVIARAHGTWYVGPRRR